MRNRFYSVSDARIAARRRMPRVMFDYVDGAAGNEFANHNNCQQLAGIRLLPRVLRQVNNRRLDTEILGQQFSTPFGIAPMGMCNLTWPNADRSLAKLAKSRNLPLAISTMSSTSLEQMARWAGTNCWFQLYSGQSGKLTMALVDRAEKAGYQTLILTVDVPVVAPRLRDLKNGFKPEMRIGPKRFIDFALHPRWSIGTLMAGKPSLANVADGGFDRNAPRGLLDWEFLDRLREKWKGNLIVKGVLSPADAVRIQSAGADAVYVSNHGGRQLESAPSAIQQLALIRQAVGDDYPLLFDSGIRDGESIVRALAVGAGYVMLGRAMLYGLGAGGAAGLEDIADLLTTEVDLAMAQLGITKTEQINQSMLVSESNYQQTCIF